MWSFKSTALMKVTTVLLVICMLISGVPFSGMDQTTGVAAAEINAKLIITFDGSGTTQVSHALPILDAAGFTATTYVCRDIVMGSDPATMRLGDVQTLYAHGWDVSNQTTNHDSTTAIDPVTMEKIAAEYLNNQNWIIGNVGARGAYQACYPSSVMVPAYLPFLRGFGVQTARAYDSLNQVTQVTPVPDPDGYFNLPSVYLHSSSSSLTRAKNAIDFAVANGTTVILKIGDASTTYDNVVYDAQGNPVHYYNFTDVINYASSYVDQGVLQVQTMSDWYRQQSTAYPLSPVTPPEPILALDDLTNKITGWNTAMAYKLDDAADYVPYNSIFNSLNLRGDHTLLVRYAAAGINPAGPPVTLTLTAAVDPAPLTKAQLIFTYDDGWKGVVANALPIMKAAGFKATAYVNRDITRDDNPKIMTIADLQTLYAEGWDIGNHTTNHDSTTLTDPATLQKVALEYLDNQNWIIDNVGPRGAYHACYPSGAYMPEFVPVLRGVGVLTARTVVDSSQITPITIPDDYYKLPTRSLSSSATDNNSLNRTLEAITQAVNEGTTLIIMLHDVQPVEGDLVTTSADLQTVVNLVNNYVQLNTLDVLSMSEWYSRETAAHPLPPVTPPAPLVAVDDATNIVTGWNIGMEFNLDGAGYVRYDSAEYSWLDLYGDHTMLVRYAASEPIPPDRTQR